MNKKHAVHIQK